MQVPCTWQHVKKLFNSSWFVNSTCKACLQTKSVNAMTQSHSYQCTTNCFKTTNIICSQPSQVLPNEIHHIHDGKHSSSCHAGWPGWKKFLMSAVLSRHVGSEVGCSESQPAWNHQTAAHIFNNVTKKLEMCCNRDSFYIYYELASSLLSCTHTTPTWIRSTFPLGPHCFSHSMTSSFKASKPSVMTILCSPKPGIQFCFNKKKICTLILTTRWHYINHLLTYLYVSYWKGSNMNLKAICSVMYITVG